MRIGILGTGIMGSTHAAVYGNIAGVEIVGIAGRDREKTKNLAKQFDSKPFTDPYQLISDLTIDAIDVCFPSHLHKEYVVAALAQGKHVFCETPIALTVEDTDAMIQAAKKYNKILLVGLLMRSVAEYQYIQKQVAAGKLGNIYSAATYRLGNYLSRNTTATRSHYGNAVTELMNFDFDVLNWFFGKPERIIATGGIIPEKDTIGYATALVTYKEVHATVEASAIMPNSFPFSVGLRITGEKGSFVLQTVFKTDIPETVVTYYPEKGEAEVIKIVSHNPYETELRYFVACIKGKADPSFLSAERAREALQVTIATQKAI